MSFPTPTDNTAMRFACQLCSPQMSIAPGFSPASSAHMSNAATAASAAAVSAAAASCAQLSPPKLGGVPTGGVV